MVVVDPKDNEETPARILTLLRLTVLPSQLLLCHSDVANRTPDSSAMGICIALNLESRLLESLGIPWHRLGLYATPKSWSVRLMATRKSMMPLVHSS